MRLTPDIADRLVRGHSSDVCREQSADVVAGHGGRYSRPTGKNARTFVQSNRCAYLYHRVAGTFIPTHDSVHLGQCALAAQPRDIHMLCSERDLGPAVGQGIRSSSSTPRSSGYSRSCVRNTCVWRPTVQDGARCNRRGWSTARRSCRLLFWPLSLALFHQFDHFHCFEYLCGHWRAVLSPCQCATNAVAGVAI